MSSSEPISSLKGIGEKTGKLFEKLGVITIDDLLSYYPRAYDTYETAVPVGQLKEQMVMSVAAALPKPPDLLRTGKIQMVQEPRKCRFSSSAVRRRKHVPGNHGFH